MTEKSLDDYEHEAKYLKTTTNPEIIRMIQAIQSAISRRDWHAVEQAGNALRDHFRA